MEPLLSSFDRLLLLKVTQKSATFSSSPFSKAQMYFSDSLDFLTLVLSYLRTIWMLTNGTFSLSLLNLPLTNKCQGLQLVWSAVICSRINKIVSKLVFKSEDLKRKSQFSTSIW